MADMRIMDCPQCAQSNHPKSVMDGIEEYRCRECGIVYYGPCGCDTGAGVARPQEILQEMPSLNEDWNAAEPLHIVQNGASSPSHPGGC